MSDHGDGHGAHQWSAKSVLYEEVIRVPFIIRWTGRIGGGRTDREHLVSNGLDLYPTICDCAGVEPPKDLMGHSLRPLLEGKQQVQWRDHLVVETAFLDKGGGTHGRAVLTQRHKYMMYDWGHNREQLVDLADDPGEMVNLAVELRDRKMLQSHRDLLAAWIRRTDDRYRRVGSHIDALPRVPGQDYERQ